VGGSSRSWCRSRLAARGIYEAAGQSFDDRGFALDVFEVDDDGDLNLKSEVVPTGMEDEVRRAVNDCPT